MKWLLTFGFISLFTLAVYSQGKEGVSNNGNGSEILSKKTENYWGHPMFDEWNLPINQLDLWGYDFVKEIDSKVRMGNEDVPAKQKIYKTPNGSYRSMVILDQNNFFYVITNTEKDENTGKKKLAPTTHFINPNYRLARRTIGKDTLLMGMDTLCIIIGQKDPVALIANVKNIPVKRFDKYVSENDIKEDINKIINNATIYWGNSNSTAEEKNIAMNQFIAKYITNEILSDRERIAKERADKIEAFWKNNPLPTLPKFTSKYKVILTDTVNSPFQMYPGTNNYIDWILAERSILTTKNSKGEDSYLSYVKIDDENFVLSQIPTKFDRITGEKVPDYENFVVGKDPFMFLRTIGNYSIYYNLLDNNVYIWIGNEYPILLYFKDFDKKTFWSFSSFQTAESIIQQAYELVRGVEKSIETFDKYEKEHPIPYTEEEKNLLVAMNTGSTRRLGFNYGSEEYKNKVNLLNKKTREQKNKQKIEYEKYINEKRNHKLIAVNPDGILTYGKDSCEYILNARICEGFYTPDKKILYYFDGLLPEYGITQRLILGKNQFVDLPVSDVITDIKQDGKIITINLNDDDYLKYTTQSNFIFDGKVKRDDGIWEISQDNNYGKGYIKAKLTLSKEQPQVYYMNWNSPTHVRGDEILIPVGCYMNDIFQDKALRLSNPGYVMTRDSHSGIIYDQEGKTTYTFHDGNLYWDEGEKKFAQMEKEKEAARKAKADAVYKALCRKYGTRYVDAAIGGKVIVGMPIGLIQELFECSIFHNYDNTYKAYEVLARPALFVEDIGKYSAKREVFLPIPFKKLIVHTTNGKVNSISYY